MPSDDGQILRNLRSHSMTAADFRRIALSLEGVEEYSHAGLPAFHVGGRKFASLATQAGDYWRGERGCTDGCSPNGVETAN